MRGRLVSDIGEQVDTSLPLQGCRRAAGIQKFLAILVFTSISDRRLARNGRVVIIEHKGVVGSSPGRNTEELSNIDFALDLPTDGPASRRDPDIGIQIAAIPSSCENSPKSWLDTLKRPPRTPHTRGKQRR